MESELKLELLTADPLGELVARLGEPTRRIEQLNRYFLPAGPSGWVVRFREEAGALVLTVKGPSGSTAPGVMDSGPLGSALFVRAEREMSVPSEVLLHLLPGADQAPLFLLPPLEGMAGPLRPAGSCRNTRWVFTYRGFDLELDCTQYPDGSSGWELEVETDRPSEALPLVSALLSELAISFRPSTKGKFARTRERLAPA